MRNILTNRNKLPNFRLRHLNMKKITVVVLGLLAANTVFGQTGATMKAYTGLDTSNVAGILNPPGSHSLSLDDAIKRAMYKNYSVTTEQLSEQSAEYEQSRTKDNLYPDLNATAGYTWGHLFNPPSFLGISTPANENSVNYSLRSTFNIYAGGFDAASIHSAEAALSAAKGNLGWLRQQTAFLVVTDYVTALRDRELVLSAVKSLAEARANLDLEQGLFQAGSAAIAVVYQQQSVVGQNELSLIQAENQFENDKADLLFQLNIAPNEYSSYNLNLDGVDTSTTTARRSGIDSSMVPAAIDRVIDTRPDIIAARATVESSQASVDVVRSALLPSLGAFAAVGGSATDYPTIQSLQPQNAFSAGLSLSVPLFDKMQNRLRVDEEEVVVEQNQVHLTQLEQQLRSDVAKAINNVHFTEQGLDASERSVVAAEETMRLADEKLRVGAGTQIDVVVAESQLVTARTNRINAVFSYVLAQKQLDYTLGRWNY
jgi:outer membrane protein